MVLSLLVATLLTDVVDVAVVTLPYKKGEMPSVNITILEPLPGFRLPSGPWGPEQCRRHAPRRGCLYAQ